MGSPRAWAVALVLQLVALAPPARAQQAAVSIAAPCPIEGITIDAVVAILRAQLAPMLVEQGTTSRDAPQRLVEVTVDACSTNHADLLVVIRYRGARHSIQTTLADVVPAARDRTLALALAEAIEHELSSGAEDLPPSVAGATAAPAPPTVTESGGPSGGAPLASNSVEALPPAPLSPPTTEQAAPDRAPGPRPRSEAALPRKPFALGLLAEPLFRYAFKTSTPYAGLEAGAGGARVGFRLRVLASERSVRDGSLWQGALLGVFSAEWLRITDQASLRSEVELGAALAAPHSSPPAVGRSTTSAHCGVATYLELEAPLSSRWALRSELGVGLASSLTSQAYSSDVLSLSGVFLQTAFGIAWNSRDR